MIWQGLAYNRKFLHSGQREPDLRSRSGDPEMAHKDRRRSPEFLRISEIMTFSDVTL